MLFSPTAGRYLNLNASGTTLWEALEEPATIAALADHLARTYGMSPSRAELDVLEFVRGLERRGMLVPESNAT